MSDGVMGSMRPLSEKKYLNSIIGEFGKRRGTLRSMRKKWNKKLYWRNVLIEMGQAYVNNKKIFFLYDMPSELPNMDEIEAMDPIWSERGTLPPSFNMKKKR